MTNEKSDSGLPPEICDYNGVIRDEEIRKAIKQGYLLSPETADENRIRQASYELRLSDNVEFLALTDTDAHPVAKYERLANGIGSTLRINPGQTTKALTIEVFNLQAMSLPTLPRSATYTR
jgi:deoxycytidine triphosphate deaminase